MAVELVKSPFWYLFKPTEVGWIRAAGGWVVWGMICNRVSAPPPSSCLRHPPLDPACHPFLKSLFSLPSFQFHSLFRYFWQFLPPSCTALIWPTNLFWFKQILKGCCFLSKIKVILIYGIFSGSFLDNLEWPFFTKLWWEKKDFFRYIHSTVLQRVK